MDGGAIILIILGLMFTGITLFAVIVRGRERARDGEGTGRLALPISSGTSVRDAADKCSEGIRLLRAGDSPAAVQAFSAAINFDPNHWTAYFRRAEAYCNLGLEQRAKADFERAEFLMAAVRQGVEESRASSDSAAADMSAGAIIGRVVGVIMGALAGLVLGCVMGIYLCIFTGPAGAIFGGIAGYRAGGGDFGCTGGCMAAFAVWGILIFFVVATWILS